MTLDEFLELESRLVKSMTIDYPGFSYLYIRGKKAYFEGSWHAPVITIANIQAFQPGNGSWNRLEKDLLDRGYDILIENLLNIRFEQALMKRGYRRIHPISLYYSRRFK